MGKEYDWRAAMKRVYVVVEGQAEQEFVRSVMAPFLAASGILSVTPILIRTSDTGKGGFVSYEHLRQKTVMPLLASRMDDFIVTTLVDFFRIPHNLPEYEECMCERDDACRVAALERAIDKDVHDPRFFSYIQLHEFEALLFADNAGFEYYFDSTESGKTAEIVSSFGTPEDINSTPEGAPSKRILAIKPDYNKVIEGNLIALHVGIDSIMNRCPRFRAWIEKIVSRASLTFNSGRRLS